MTFPVTPPISSQPRPWSFPPTAATLCLGTQIEAARVATLPLVQVRWTFLGGATREPFDLAGLGRLLAAVARHGTARFSSEQLAERVDHLGARLRVSVGQDSGVVSLTGLAEHLWELLDLLDEVAFRPTFPEDALARERATALELHEHDRMQPEPLAARWLAWLLYPDHPYGRPPATAAGLNAVKREHLLDFHRRLFHPGHAQLAVVGDVDPDAVVAALAARLPGLVSALGLGPAPALTDPLAVEPGDLPRIAVNRPGAEQVAIAAGVRAIPRSHPDYLALRLACQVLGGGTTSRLFTELRQKRSLTYGAYSVLDAGRLAGDLVATLATAPPKAAEALTVLLEELRRIGEEPIGEDELELARRALIGSFPQRASGVGGIGGLLASRWLNGLPEQVWSRHQASLAEVTPEAVGAAAARWLRVERAPLVIVGPKEATEESLGGLGVFQSAEASDPPFERC